jgi:hypothetical protein
MAKAGSLGGLITRHIIWAAATETVASIITVLMTDIFSKRICRVIV